MAAETQHQAMDEQFRVWDKILRARCSLTATEVFFD
ncbi:hypothetical protein AVDCRST_MAG81-2552 [uncultured Synechococcales cyanobacterium]|uniref:Uncharacterized protein n=1 Tax=uncultured Synechococcales cyanobacterium TaxID=1936017 RepID=A0A6J4VH49_9CYAN|nr:hypothetical protein AVDCRST_MAG81-2552 [uncultured Synechococcales cyanobacterium]